MHFPHGPGYGMFGGVIESVIAGIFFLVCFVIVVGVLVVLVRFLLVATKAAEIYVARNGSAQSTVSATPASAPAPATSTVATPPAGTTTTTTPVAKSAAPPRTRTPKTPPTV